MSVWFVRAAIECLRRLPLSVAKAIGRMIAFVVYLTQRRKFEMYWRHFRIALDRNMSRSEARARMKANFRHIGMLAAEATHISRINAANVGRFVDLSEMDALTRLRAKGRGLIFATGHFGNWEVCCCATAAAGMPVSMIYRQIPIPALDEAVLRLRQGAGVQAVLKFQSLWRMKKMLDRGETVVLAVDQDGKKDGEFVPFCGVAACTLTTPAALQQVTGAPIAVVTCARMADGRHKFSVRRTFEAGEGTVPENMGDRQAERMRITRQINEAFEEALRECPDQWLWGYKRWKTRPPGERPGPDGLPPLLPEAELRGAAAAPAASRTA